MSPTMAINKSPGCAVLDVGWGGVGLLFINSFFAALVYSGCSLVLHLGFQLRVMPGFAGGFVGSGVRFFVGIVLVVLGWRFSVWDWDWEWYWECVGCAWVLHPPSAVRIVLRLLGFG